MADGTITIDVELNETAFKSSLENMGEVVKSGSDSIIKSVDKISRSFTLMPDSINTALTSIPNIINGVINKITEKNPVMTQTGTELFTSLIGNMPDITSKISDSVPEIINTVKQKITDFLPDMSDTGDKFFSSLTSNMPDIITKITDTIPGLTEQTAQSILNGTEGMSQAGYDLFCSITKNMPSVTEEIGTAPEQIMSVLLANFNSLTSQFRSVGENIARGVWGGLTSMGSWLSNNVRSFFNGIVGSVTGFLGISSPSRLFRDLVGKNIALGVKSGIDSEMPNVISGTHTQMTKLAKTANQSSRLNIGAADIIGQSNTSGISEMKSIMRSQADAEKSMQGQSPAVNVTLEPTGDMRGFFDYIRVGVKRSGYLSGEA